MRRVKQQQTRPSETEPKEAFLPSSSEASCQSKRLTRRGPRAFQYFPEMPTTAPCLPLPQNRNLWPRPPGVGGTV